MAQLSAVERDHGEDFSPRIGDFESTTRPILPARTVRLEFRNDGERFIHGGTDTCMFVPVLVRKQLRTVSIVKVIAVHGGPLCRRTRVESRPETSIRPFGLAVVLRRTGTGFLGSVSPEEFSDLCPLLLKHDHHGYEKR